MASIPPDIFLSELFIGEVINLSDEAFTALASDEEKFEIIINNLRLLFDRHYPSIPLSTKANYFLNLRQTYNSEAILRELPIRM